MIQTIKRWKSKATRYSKLGKEIKISPKAKVDINESGLTMEYEVPSVTVLIGIGKDHTADLIMSEDAWNALQTEPISIDTLKEFKSKWL